MKVVLTNDDGIHALGMKALIESIPDGIEAVVCAPASERSATSHSITIGQKLRVEEFKDGRFRQYAVHGTPADCVKFALGGLTDFTPDLILSGINQGANTGVSVYYSGTISAAREGFINRIPAVAISLCSTQFKDFSAAKEITHRIALGYMAGRFPKNVMLSVNVPAIPLSQVKGVKITKQASSRFIEEFIPEKDHEGTKVFSLAGEIEVMDSDGTSDEEAVVEGYISITPLKLDLTEYHVMPYFQEWVNDCRMNPASRKEK